MSEFEGKRSRTAESPPATSATAPVGKHTLVEQIHPVPVQRRADPAGNGRSEGAQDANPVHAAAARGTATPGSPLPHADRIQHLFGRHDVSSIQAHTGSEARASTEAMGAEAYATGNHVVLGGNADLATVAHEAAHVVQQRGGVQLKGGVGQDGDAHEQHADAVAARVVAGQSAEDLLDERAAPGGGASVAVQQTRKRTQATVAVEDDQAENADMNVDEADGDAGRAAKRLKPMAQGYKPLPGLDDQQARKVKKVIRDSGDSDEASDDEAVDEPVAQVDEKIVKELVTALTKYATTELKHSPDKPGVPIDDQNAYQRVFKRAVDVVVAKYGLQIQENAALTGDTTASDNLSNAKLHHASDRWKNAEEADKSDAGTAAIEWAMSNAPEPEQILQRAAKLHPKSSTGSIIEAYSNELVTRASSDPAVANMKAQLAQLRLSWGPITYGPDIYLEIPKKSVAKKDQWWLYKTLIHESLHSVEHPQFTEFLHTAVSPGLRSVLQEGITEYITMKLWAEVVAKVKVEKTDGPGPDSGAAELGTTKTQLAALTTQAKQLSDAYPSQVALVTAIVNALDDGDQRLEQAYFYGNMQALLPDLMPSSTSA